MRRGGPLLSPASLSLKAVPAPWASPLARSGRRLRAAPRDRLVRARRRRLRRRLGRRLRAVAPRALDLAPRLVQRLAPRLLHRLLHRHVHAALHRTVRLRRLRRRRRLGRHQPLPLALPRLLLLSQQRVQPLRLTLQLQPALICTAASRGALLCGHAEDGVGDQALCILRQRAGGRDARLEQRHLELLVQLVLRHVALDVLRGSAAAVPQAVADQLQRRRTSDLSRQLNALPDVVHEDDAVVRQGAGGVVER